MNLANVFKPTGSPVKKAEKTAKAMILRKVVAKSETQKKVEQVGSVAAAMGLLK